MQTRSAGKKLYFPLCRFQANIFYLSLGIFYFLWEREKERNNCKAFVHYGIFFPSCSLISWRAHLIDDNAPFVIMNTTQKKEKKFFLFISLALFSYLWYYLTLLWIDASIFFARMIITLSKSSHFFWELSHNEAFTF